MNYSKELIEAGLKEKEALIYTILLKSGTVPATEIVKESKLKRGIVYKTLQDLTDKGLVINFIKDKKMHFKAEHPYKLADLVKNNYLEAKKNQEVLQILLPQLLTSFKEAQNRPGINIYEGFENVKKIYEDMLREEGSKSIILNKNSTRDEVVKEWVKKNYIAKEVKKKDSWARMLFSEDPEAERIPGLDTEKKREVRIVSEDRLPTGVDLYIYNDKVAFINRNKDTEIYGIVIQNKFIQTTIQALFDLAWEYARKE